MANAQTAVEEVWEALAAHFRRSADPVEVPEHVVEMTGLDEEAVINAVLVLENNNQIEGLADLDHSYLPTITRVLYH